MSLVEFWLEFTVGFLVGFHCRLNSLAGWQAANTILVKIVGGVWITFPAASVRHLGWLSYVRQAEGGQKVE